MNSGRKNPIIGYEHPETLNTVSKLKKFYIFSHKTIKFLTTNQIFQQMKIFTQSVHQL